LTGFKQFFKRVFYLFYYLSFINHVSPNLYVLAIAKTIYYSETKVNKFQEKNRVFINNGPI
jgi:hypothetical protein